MTTQEPGRYERPPIPDTTSWSAEARSVAAAITAGPRGSVEGPLKVWLNSPSLADKAQKLGAFCRYGTRLPARLSELAIIVIGEHWKSSFEWHVHAPLAEREGIGRAAVEAIRRGREPVLEKADERAVYAFSRQLLTTRQVSDASYRDAVDQIGMEGTVELVGILGYYGLICMTINAFNVPVPEGAEDPFGGQK